MIKKLVFFVLALVVITFQATAQVGSTYVNRIYEESFGQPVFNPILNPFGVQWSKSIVNGSGQHITVAHSYVSGEGENITLTKTDISGTVIFQVDTNTAGSNNDYGIGVYEDPTSHNIFICGTTDNGGGTAAYSSIIIKYDQYGHFIASTSIGSSGLNYIATALTIHPGTGNLLVALSAEGATTGYDYKVVKLNATTLSTITSNTYDYASLTEVPLGIEVNPANGQIIVVGGSQSSATGWAYAEAVFNGTSLAAITSTRTNLGGLGYDEPAAYKKEDNTGVIYITGRSWDVASSKYVMLTVKIDASYSIAWTSTLAIHGEDNGAVTIDTDPVTGDVIIGGYATKTNMVKELYSARLDASNGTVISTHSQNSEDYSADASIKKLCTNTSGDVYFVAGEKAKTGVKQVIVGKIKADGTASWQKKIGYAGSNVLPSDIEVTSDGIYVISVVSGTANTYLTTKYTEFEMDTSRAFSSGGKANYMKHQLIVRFKGEVMDSAVIDNTVGTKISEFGQLSDFLTTGAYNQLNAALEGVCFANAIKAVKVFPDFPTTYTSATSRLGETVPVENFWTTLLLEFPSSSNIGQINQILEANKSVVTYAHPNFLGKMASGPPNDPYYSYQGSLFGTLAGINVEPCWYQYGVQGKPYVRVGIFDTGVDYFHEDFDRGFGGGLVTSIVDGWDFYYNVNIKATSIPDEVDHGTRVAGIIGANWNNSTGIAGIADGVDMYSLDVVTPMASQVSLVYLANAIVGACFDSLYPAPFAYQVNLMNHSWRFDNVFSTYNYTDSNIHLLSDALHTVNRLKVTVVAARGNEGVNNDCYPANTDDDWVLTVGGTGVNGAYASSSVSGNMSWAPSYGGKIDLAAPFVSSLIYSTSGDTSNSVINNYDYFSGTSASAPHVTGVAALLMSYLNDSLPNSYGNLAPEDCEYILQKSATDVNASGYDTLTGYGRLNAGAALAMVEKPYYSLKHFGTNNSANTINVSLYSSNDTIRLLENYTNYDSTRTLFNSGKYILKTFQVDATVNHSLPFTDTIKYAWPRPSSSYILQLFDPLKKTLYARERVILNSCTGSGASLTGYVYQVYDTTGTFKGWWPCDTNFTSPNLHSLFEYSLISRNLTVGIKEEKENKLSVDLFPNPASTSQMLRIRTKESENLNIDLYDLMGRKLKTVYKGKTSIGEITVVHQLENLPNSMYIYLIKLGERTLTKKFIKE